MHNRSRTCSIPMGGLSRRQVLTGASTALTVAAAKAAFPRGAFAQGAGPEVKGTRLGYIALTDASPLVIAKEKGFFARHGLPDMDIAKQASWGATRDNMALGTKANGIDGGHILRPKVHLYATGKVMQNNQPLAMYTLLNLNEDCQAISVSNEFKDLKIAKDASPLKAAFEKKKAAGKEVKVAMTFPGGTHDLWIRYWLAAGGVDPDKDVQTIVVPPPQMVANMRVGNMDAFCVGEPWNQQLINQRIGYTGVQTQEVWKDHPEKSFAMRKDWVDANPIAAKALLKAVMEAQMWCDKPENAVELATILSQKGWINCQVDDLLPRIKGHTEYGDGKRKAKEGEFMKFWKDHASFPYKSHDKWFLAETRRWGFLPNGVDYDKVISQVNRSDLWRECAKEIGQEAMIPASDSRGVETFFDGVTFDPADPEGYLAKLKIKNIDGKKGAVSRK